MINNVKIKGGPLVVILPEYADTNEVYDLYYDTRLEAWTVSVVPNGKDVNGIVPF